MEGAGRGDEQDVRGLRCPSLLALQDSEFIEIQLRGVGCL